MSLLRRFICSFQSTLPRGERQIDYLYEVYDYLFQSTLPRGERLSFYIFYCWGYVISIHAPAWGATITLIFYEQNVHNFNPRSRVGSDLEGDYIFLTANVFQSTLPRGERQKRRHAKDYDPDFNPRSRVGSDR